MITLLSKLFIKDRDNVNDPEVRTAYGVLCGIVGIVLNVILFVGKFVAGALSGSIAVTADAFNNLSDAGSSLVTMIGFRLAGQKPDPDHPFGHGRFEYISGFIVSIAVLLMGFELASSSIGKILEPEGTEFSVVSVVILSVSVLVKLYMAFYNRSVGKRIGSAAISATAADSLSDSISTVVVLASTLLSHFADIMIDGWCGLAVSIFIFIAGIRSAKETVSPLLGQPPEPEFVRSVLDIVNSSDSIIGIHDMIVHNYGPGRLMVSLHAEVPANSDFLAVHDVIDNIEHRIATELGCSAVIHMDPIVVDDELLNDAKSKVAGSLKEIDEAITIHDFRMVSGPTHTNLIFDAVIPYSLKLSEDEVRAAICERVERIDPNYRTVVEIDRDFVGK